MSEFLPWTNEILDSRPWIFVMVHRKFESEAWDWMRQSSGTWTSGMMATEMNFDYQDVQHGCAAIGFETDADLLGFYLTFADHEYRWFRIVERIK